MKWLKEFLKPKKWKVFIFIFIFFNGLSLMFSVGSLPFLSVIELVLIKPLQLLPALGDNPFFSSPLEILSMFIYWYLLACFIYFLTRKIYSYIRR